MPRGSVSEYVIASTESMSAKRLCSPAIGVSHSTTGNAEWGPCLLKGTKARIDVEVQDNAVEETSKVSEPRSWTK